MSDITIAPGKEGWIVTQDGEDAEFPTREKALLYASTKLKNGTIVIHESDGRIRRIDDDPQPSLTA